jgi:ferric iron reductase protein FhuF
VLNTNVLQKFQVHIIDQANGYMSLNDCIHHSYDVLISDISKSYGSPNKAVATSIFMRRYGLFIAAQLYLKAHNKVWAGTLEQIYVFKTADTISFQIDPHFIRDEQEGDLERILNVYCHSVVEALSQKGTLSKLVLWENIWGYVMWMYSQTHTLQAKADLAILLKDDIWQQEMRTSMFRKFLGGRTFEEASSEFKRKTCCLLKELPNTDCCPYCPYLQSDSSQ